MSSTTDEEEGVGVVVVAGGGTTAPDAESDRGPGEVGDVLLATGKEESDNSSERWLEGSEGKDKAGKANAAVGGATATGREASTEGVTGTPPPSDGGP